MKKITTMLSAAMMFVAFASAAIADGHAAGEKGMHHGPMSMPAECEVAAAMIEEAGLDPAALAEMMMNAGPDGDPAAGLADAMGGDMRGAEQLMADLEATGSSPETCGMMPPGMHHGPGKMGPKGMGHGPEGMMDHGPGGMGPEGM